MDRSRKIRQAKISFYILTGLLVTLLGIFVVILDGGWKSDTFSAWALAYFLCLVAYQAALVRLNAIDNDLAGRENGYWLLWALLPVFFQPVGPVIAYLIILPQGQENEWF